MLGNQLLISADDWTGASDTALAFFEHGLSASLLCLNDVGLPFSPPDSKMRVLSMNTNTRNQCIEDAYAWTCQQLPKWQSSFNVDWYYRKMDSTLRGPFVADTLPWLQQGIKKCCLVVPAYPDMQRSTVGGYQLLEGVPIHRSEFRNDPHAPVLESFLPDVIRSQLKRCGIAEDSPFYSVGQIPLTVVNKGAGAIVSRLKALAAEGVCWIVADATTTSDLEQLALAFRRLQRELQLLPMGVAGFAHALADVWQQQVQSSPDVLSESPTSPLWQPRGVSIISGSTTSKTQEQVQQVLALAKEQHWPLATLCPAPDAWFEPTLPNASKLEAACMSLIASCVQAGDKAAVQALGEAAGLNTKQVARRIEQGLALLSERIPASHTLILCGGATAQVVLKQLGIQQLRMKRRLQDTVALLEDTRTHRHIILKSGNMGEPSTLTELLLCLKNDALKAQEADS